jgi:hypothetical protein
MKKVISITILVFSISALYAQQTSTNLSYSQINQNNAIAQSAWQTIQESNSRAAQVVKPYGHQEWRTTVNVVVQSPTNTPSTAMKYMYTENANSLLNNNNTTVDYGIKQVDVSGSTSLNELRTINNNQQASRASVFPNPSTNGNVTIALANANALHDIFLISMSGVIIDQWRSIRGTNYQINNLSRGTYVLKIINKENGQISTEKIIVSGY